VSNLDTPSREGLLRPAIGENANAITHATGIAISIPAVWFLLKQTRTPLEFWSCLVYGITLIAVYTSSTCLHTASRHRLRHRLELLDHSAIYLLIAGTFTPFVARIGGKSGALCLACGWAMAAAGVAFKLIFGLGHPRISIASYLVMGWFPIALMQPILRATSWPAVEWLLVGGVAYTAGVPFFLISRKRPRMHVVWHLFVLLGSACHYVAILISVRGEVERALTLAN